MRPTTQPKGNSHNILDLSDQHTHDSIPGGSDEIDNIPKREKVC